MLTLHSRRVMVDLDIIQRNLTQLAFLRIPGGEREGWKEERREGMNKKKGVRRREKWMCRGEAPLRIDGALFVAK